MWLLCLSDTAFVYPKKCWLRFQNLLSLDLQAWFIAQAYSSVACQRRVIKRKL